MSSSAKAVAKYRQGYGKGLVMAARKWTPEQRAAQANKIREWRPWQHSTGARTPHGKAIVSRNAYRGGMRPFLRLINSTCNMFDRPGTLTVEMIEDANRRMDELIAKDYEWRNSKRWHRRFIEGIKPKR